MPELEQKATAARLLLRRALGEHGRLVY